MFCATMDTNRPIDNTYRIEKLKSTFLYDTRDAHSRAAAVINDLKATLVAGFPNRLHNIDTFGSIRSNLLFKDGKCVLVFSFLSKLFLITSVKLFTCRAY